VFLACARLLLRFFFLRRQISRKAQKSKQSMNESGCSMPSMPPRYAAALLLTFCAALRVLCVVHFRLLGADEERFTREALKLQAAYAQDSSLLPMSCIYVHPSGGRLFLGNASSSKDEKMLSEFNVTHIINCTRELPNYHPQRYQYYRFTITDCFHWHTLEEVRENFEPALVWMHEALSQGNSVLCHCLAGAHRSAVTISLYLYWKVKRDKAWCLKIVKQRRKIADPGLYADAWTKATRWIDTTQ
jgi:protein-tyrosine phosphatase